MEEIERSLVQIYHQIQPEHQRSHVNKISNNF